MEIMMTCKGVTHALLSRNGNFKLGGGILEKKYTNPK